MDKRFLLEYKNYNNKGFSAGVWFRVKTRKGKKMGLVTPQELMETLRTWILIYKSISMPGPAAEKRGDEFTEKWNKGMLKVVASLKINPELKGTPVEKHMEKAIENGKSKDISRLDDICVLLSEVEKYITERAAV